MQRKHENRVSDFDKMIKFWNFEDTTSSEKQKEVDDLIINMVVNGSRPLSIVEDDDFRKLCHGEFQYFLI